MQNKLIRVAGIFAFCGFMSLMATTSAYASHEEILSGPGVDDGDYIVTVEADSVNVNKEHGSDIVLGKAKKGSKFQVIEDMGDGWVKVQVGDGEGYIPLDGNASISAYDGEEEAGEGGAVTTFGQVEVTSQRETLVNYALQFVGGPYRYGGRDPRTGVDCSGFTSYVMLHGAGVTLNRSSGSQASQGVAVSAEQMRPGDLIFYGSSRKINHVGMYIGNGQIVHASTYETGIKTSNWNYRNPVKIVNVMGD